MESGFPLCFSYRGVSLVGAVPLAGQLRALYLFDCWSTSRGDFKLECCGAKLPQNNRLIRLSYASGFERAGTNNYDHNGLMFIGSGRLLLG
jgi:hypothetical protein